MVNPNIVAQAEDWLRHAPDPETRAELAPLVAERASELEERFAGPLEFGTAGLRGVLGAGESRMNRAVVRRASAGRGRYLLDHTPARDGKRSVVVGYDGRRMSREFAAETAAVLCAAGIETHLSNKLCPTPIVAFGVRELGAAAGVMVTASHNPPAYNGYKVYAANGAQIIPPTDKRIAEAIAHTGPADTVPVLELGAATERGLLHPIGEPLDQRYLDTVLSLVPARGGNRALPIAYTPMHGVGHRLMRRAFELAGFTAVETVAEQAEPDGAFPTVTFPNPEEPGALDLAVALARRIDAALVVANDPDADRLAICVRRAPGDYRQLSGNEVGVLLGHHLLERHAALGAERLVVTTIVSSPALGAMARELGAQYAETLTGFKWIANRAMQLEASGKAQFIFGYEEALGYTVGTAVRDKDGISAALVLCALAAELDAQGKSLLDRLDEIAVRFGLFESAQRSVVLPGRDGVEHMARIMAELRREPPSELAGHSVAAVVDCQTGKRQQRGQQPAPIELPPSNVLVFELAGGHRVIARPSGTEPKIKFYFDVREPVASVAEVGTARERARRQLGALERALLARVGLG